MPVRSRPPPSRAPSTRARGAGRRNQATTTSTATGATGAQGAQPVEPLAATDRERVLGRNNGANNASSASAGVTHVSARMWTPAVEAPRLAPVNILDVRPAVDGGDFAIKRIAGETLRVFADIIKEGHDHVRARVVVTEPDGKQRRVEMTYDYNNDEWHGDIALAKLGRHTYAIESFSDHFGTWADFLGRKVKAGRDIQSELLEGEQMLRAAAKRATSGDRAALTNAAKAIADASAPPEKRAAVVDDALLALMRKHEAQTDLSTSHQTLPVMVERGRAKMGAWYEMFPRSITDDPKKHGTLRQAEKRLPDIAKMGFDIVYLPPIHPIGESARKGKNNSETAQPGDVGSPWAIGSKHGGHDAVHPELGTVKDFEHFVAAAKKSGLEVALDFAVQCAPDHPWVTEHPDWFKRRPDGTIQYAENPPKVYQDIVQLDMWGARRDDMWNAIKDVMTTWIDRGVKVFRVDNPHTKPPAFWEWLIREVHTTHPDVVFLSEAFARPKKQELYTKLGFSQSYTYFTWKNSRPELEEFMRDMVSPEKANHFRPNFFANTPDILPEYLQTGGRAAFEVRYALAGTLSPSAGIYSGFELLEGKALKGEDYLHSEKYEVKPRDWDAPGNIKEFITKVNEIRRDNPALHELTNLTLQNADNPNLLSFSKVKDGNKILVVANLDPHNTHEATLRLDGAALGLRDDSKYVVHDLITGAKYPWSGLANYVKLSPLPNPVHVFRIEEE